MWFWRLGDKPSTMYMEYQAITFGLWWSAMVWNIVTSIFTLKHRISQWDINVCITMCVLHIRMWIIILLDSIYWGIFYSKVENILLSFYSIFLILYFLTLYTLTSVCIFSILFSTHFLMVLTRRICLTAKNFLFDDHFLYSSNVWFRGDIVRRN